jgi:hypothetical protein
MTATNTRTAVELVLLVTQGLLDFSPLPKEVAHLGHVLVWSAEGIFFLWNHRQWLTRLWQAGRHSD